MGEGEPPDDGVNFVDYVTSLEPSSLCKLRFAVFALGGTSYDNFCQCGRDLDRMLEERGAMRLLDRVDNDIDFEGALDKWHEALVAMLPDTVAASDLIAECDGEGWRGSAQTEPIHLGAKRATRCGPALG